MDVRAALSGELKKTSALLHATCCKCSELNVFDSPNVNKLLLELQEKTTQLLQCLSTASSHVTITEGTVAVYNKDARSNCITPGVMALKASSLAELGDIDFFDVIGSVLSPSPTAASTRHSYMPTETYSMASTGSFLPIPGDHHNLSLGFMPASASIPPNANFSSCSAPTTSSNYSSTYSSEHFAQF
jgi:hypothetical protein